MNLFDADRRALAIQFFKFGIVGGIGFVFDSALTYSGIYVLGLGRVAAGLVSFPFAVTLTWFGNRVFTFADAPKARIGRQWAKFASVCTIGIVFNRGTYSLLVTTVPLVYQYPILGLFAGTLVAMFFNFFVARKVVFR